MYTLFAIHQTRWAEFPLCEDEDWVGKETRATHAYKQQCVCKLLEQGVCVSCRGIDTGLALLNWSYCAGHLQAERTSFYHCVSGRFSSLCNKIYFVYFLIACPFQVNEFKLLHNAPNTRYISDIQQVLLLFGV